MSSNAYYGLSTASGAVSTQVSEHSVLLMLPGPQLEALDSWPEGPTPVWLLEFAYTFRTIKVSFLAEIDFGSSTLLHSTKFTFTGPQDTWWRESEQGSLAIDTTGISVSDAVTKYISILISPDAFLQGHLATTRSAHVFLEDLPKVLNLVLHFMSINWIDAKREFDRRNAKK